MKIAAAIFDLDGTIIDSEEAWGKTYSNILKGLGAKVSETESHTFGASVESNLKTQITKHNIKTNKTIEELATLTFIEFQKFIPLTNLNEGAVEFMESLKEGGVPLALATSANWEVAEKVLAHFDLAYLFDTITTVEEIDNPKPFPDIYLLTAKKLGVEPEDCLVFEDSGPGVTAAKEAGMKVVAIDPTGEKENVENADLVVGSFSEVTSKAIDQL